MNGLNKQTDNDLKQWANVFNMEFNEIKHMYLEAEAEYKYKCQLDNLTEYLKSETNNSLNIYKTSQLNEMESFFRSIEKEKPKANLRYETVQFEIVEEPILIKLENKLGYTLSIESKFIDENSYTVNEYVKKEIENINNKIIEVQTYSCNNFNLFIKYNDIMKIEEHQQGALNFLKNAQIFKVYLIFDDRKEVLTVPWSDRYIDSKNDFQEIIEEEEGIFIRIKKQK